MKINLGSNDVLHEGFKNVDIRDIPEVDIVDDFTKLEKIADNSVEHMICHNIFHILAIDKAERILKLWVSKLADGGIIEIGVPDGEFIFDRYTKNHNWKKLTRGIFGGVKFLRAWHGDDAELYMAHNLYCESSLRGIMSKVGLKDIVKVKPNHPDNITLKAKKYVQNQS